LRGAYVRASEEAFVHSTVDDIDAVLDEMEGAVARSVLAGHEAESLALIDGLVLIGCTTPGM